MSAVIVVATITPKAGEEAAVKEALLATIPKVHAEPGCGKYALHERSVDDGAEFVMLERWESEQDLKAHGAAPALAELGGALKGRLAAPLDVRYLTGIPAGTAEQGTI
ncbi:putative quinol monooxygenase [Pseudonocardia sp. WMMC193]|uniref:putative quinol monooxygenase n=1 Tax=Pseudonocardia sp. WMMC193 TaxID=2911965 RepID=UPI001F3FD723|nr:putative quinol monooxygenase [Pseudonocardia sp. WMMC193]MCF7553487.1 antibiotic biosynthesis monooxygenase [Pseudonocardia sp. WMMC193]